MYISSLNVDMRKSIDGLVYIVEQKFKLPAQTDMMFVFHNRHCDKVKSCIGTVTAFACCINASKETSSIFQKCVIKTL